MNEINETDRLRCAMQLIGDHGTATCDAITNCMRTALSGRYIVGPNSRHRSANVVLQRLARNRRDIRHRSPRRILQGVKRLPVVGEHLRIAQSAVGRPRGGLQRQEVGGGCQRSGGRKRRRRAGNAGLRQVREFVESIEFLALIGGIVGDDLEQLPVRAMSLALRASSASARVLLPV